MPVRRSSTCVHPTRRAPPSPAFPVRYRSPIGRNPGNRLGTAYRHCVRTVSRRRPTPLQWLRYAYGAGLPRDLAPWVLRDTTAHTWVWRHLARAVVQVLPLVVGCLLVPVSFGYRVSMAAGGLLLALMFSMA